MACISTILELETPGADLGFSQRGANHSSGSLEQGVWEPPPLNQPLNLTEVVYQLCDIYEYCNNIFYFDCPFVYKGAHKTHYNQKDPVKYYHRTERKFVFHIPYTSKYSRRKTFTVFAVLRIFSSET